MFPSMNKSKIKKLVRFIVISFILYFLFPYLLVTILSATNIISVRPSFFVALIIVAVIDNLLKGASGQAVQNMNIMCKFPESSGLL